MSAYYRPALFRSAVCHKHCMAVTSVFYRSAIGRSAIPYCNSDVGRLVGSVKKLYDRQKLYDGGRQVGNSVHRTCRLVYRRPAYCQPSILYSVFVERLPANRLPASYSLVSAYYLPVYLETCQPSNCLPFPLYLPTD